MPLCVYADIRGQRYDATVSTRCMHAFSKDITREDEIVVALAGVPNLVRGSWLKP